MLHANNSLELNRDEAIFLAHQLLEHALKCAQAKGPMSYSTFTLPTIDGSRRDPLPSKFSFYIST